jgi:hypothetical protein
LLGPLLVASIIWWYLHAPRTRIRARDPKVAVLPYVYAVVVSLICAYLVALVSSQWDEAKTQAWLSTSIYGVLFKLIIWDLGRSICCPCVEPLVNMINPGECGGCGGDLLVSEAMEQMENGLEDQADDVAGMLAAGANLDALFEESSDEEATKKTADRERHVLVLAAGSLGAAKWVQKLQKSRAKTKAARSMTEMVKDHAATQHRLQVKRSNSQALYAEKIALKRMRQGLGRGQFAAQAEADLMAAAHADAAMKRREHEERGESSRSRRGADTSQAAGPRVEEPTAGEIWQQALSEHESHHKQLQRMAALKSSRTKERVMRRAGFIGGGGALATNSTSTEQPRQKPPRPLPPVASAGAEARRLRRQTLRDRAKSTVTAGASRRPLPAPPPGARGGEDEGVRSAEPVVWGQVRLVHLALVHLALVHLLRPVVWGQVGAPDGRLDAETLAMSGMVRSSKTRNVLKVKMPPLPG